MRDFQVVWQHLTHLHSDLDVSLVAVLVIVIMVDLRNFSSNLLYNICQRLWMDACFAQLYADVESLRRQACV